MGEIRSAGHRAVLLGGILVTAVVLLGFGATAIAQEQQQEKPPEFKEEVTVTGTLIPRPTLEALSPVATMDVEELAYQGATRLEDMLTSLPQIYRGQNSTQSNNATGTATIDLRYMGSNRTLVLVDGKRLPSGDPYAIAPDLNFIPPSLVKRVDTLTGGASATYGADAVAGVVNFILDRDFEGMKASISGGGYEHDNSNKTEQAMNADLGFQYPTGQAWDGGNFDASAAWGGKFADGRGHATMYIDYRKIAPLLKSRRDYTNCAQLDDYTTATPPYCGGSPTIPQGRFRVIDPTNYHKLGDYTREGDTFRTHTSADVFNYAPYNYLQRPDIRWAGGGFINYEWNKHFQAYADVMLMNDTSDGQIAPSGSFGSGPGVGYTLNGTNFYEINCNNPMLSADEQAKICQKPYTDSQGNTFGILQINKRGVEGGGRDGNWAHESYRLVGGLKGEINKVWSYDVYGLDAETHVMETYLHDYSWSKMQDALLVDGDPNDPSTWACRSGNSGCVPWNVFKTGGITQAALDYVQLPYMWESLLTTKVVSGKVVGDLKDYGIAFPGATEGVSVAIGAETRKEYLNFQPDETNILGLGAGAGGAVLPVHGQYSVQEGFAEVEVPILQGMRGAKDLSFDLGYRYSKYNLSGNHNTFKVQGTWAPTDDFKLRASYNRAVRAPNIQELFSPTNVAIGDVTADPCAGPTPIYTAEQCARTGVTAAQYGNIDPNTAHQYNTRTGGNVLLNPEIADTKTFGVVITPSGLSGFSTTLDYFDIKLKGAIATLPGNAIVTQCAETGAANLCSLIHRDVLGTLWTLTSGYVDESLGNFDTIKIKGVDANVSYSTSLGKSVLSLSLIGTYQDTWEFTTPFYSYDCVGYMGNTCGNPTPKWRHLFRATLDTGPVTVSLGWRYIGAVTVDEANPSPALYTPADLDAWKAFGSYHYPAYNYVDLAFTFKLLRGMQWMLGVNNIADKAPPNGIGFSPNDYGTGFYGTYDPYGRYIHSSLDFNF